LADFVVFSDLHLHEWTYGASYTESGFNSRLEAMKKSLLEMCDYCQENNIIDILFCGDFFHTQSTLSVQAIQAAFQFFEKTRELGLNLHLLVGNHDVSDKKQAIHSLHMFKPYAHVIEEEEVFQMGRWTVAALPFCEDEKKIKHFLNVIAPEAHFAIMHQGVKNVPMASGVILNEILSENMIPESLVHCFVGHYHHHRKVNPHFTVVGSFTHQTWSDANSVRGFLHYKVDTNIVKLIETSAPKFFAFDYPNIDETKIRGNMIRVLNCPLEKIEDLQEMFRRQGALVVDFQSTETKESKEKRIENYYSLNLNSLISQFEKNLDEDRKKIGRALREGTYEAIEV